jgi:hypothetical protein
MSQKPRSSAGKAGIVAVKLVGISAPLVDVCASRKAGGVDSASAKPSEA